MNSLLLVDGYKLSHADQYPDNTELVYSNFTPRSTRTGIPFVIAFGFQQMFQRFFVDDMKANFFDRPFEEVGEAYKAEVDAYMNDNIDLFRIKELHELGYLPLTVKALKEGTLVPLKIPVFTIVNSQDVPNPERFYWLTNYFETLVSCEGWLPITSATTAFCFNVLLTKYAMETVGNADFVPFQAHDFSFRGMAGVGAALSSGAAHLTSFVGTDTFPAIPFIKKYYNAGKWDYKTSPYAGLPIVGCSVKATEHSVMCAGGELDERETYLRLLTKVYPKGIVSIVSDTWDYWNVLTNILPSIKTEIMGRDGKLVIRPDSGDSVKMICGYTIFDMPKFPVTADFEKAEGFDLVRVDGVLYDYKTNKQVDLTEAELKGTIEVLWDLFGGTTTDKGYKLLDSHIGCILGDGVTLKNCEEMLMRLRDKGFASINMVFGIGSYTYQYVTRDTYGMAMKATFVKVNGVSKAIFKDPKTNDGSFTKKSAKGLITIDDSDGALSMRDEVTWEQEAEGALEVIFKNGVMTNPITFAEIRDNVKANHNHPLAQRLFK